MIKAENFSYSFPQKDLYDNISFSLEEGQHCAFIGTSGSGKSTLVNILMNPDNYMYDGSLEIAPNSRIGYVSQFSQLDSDTPLTVFEYIGEKFIHFQKEIASICTEMETATDLEPLLEQYQLVLDAYDAIGGDDYESIIRKNLNLADLIHQENQLVSNLSGGEFKLVQVIKEMLTQPDLLIMDEPDVFLDFEHLNSLRDLINSHKGIILVITHNRYLLNHCFNKILHLENKELQEFNGDYIDYHFSLLMQKIELQELAVADEEEIQRNEEIINQLRNVASTHFEAARGKTLNARVKIRERLEARKIKAPFVYIKQPEISLTTDFPLETSPIVSVNNLSISFDDLLLDNINFEINATDKIALIGENGTGKTTLLKAIYKNQNPAIVLDPQVKLGLLSQIQGEMLTETNTILEEFFELGFQTRDEIISYANNYGFEEDILHQKIELLSGGEKNMLQLAKLSLSNANLLLLDEPTSHLDTYSQLALEDAISKYNGAVLMISHDFYSIANCVDYVLIIENKTIRKVSMRKFRKIIYAHHFDQNYLAFEEKKKNIETKIALALNSTNFALAKELSVELEKLLLQR